MLDATILARIQFAFTISFHILFPAFSIGLAFFLCFMEACWLKTKNKKYLQICKFWTKIFALTFGMGIISGIVMEYQFGTNWSRFTHEVGGVLGALFTYEVMTAFFIEAGFLGVMLFGWKRFSPKMHFTATCLVVIGTTISAYWIMAANTWMQHPIAYAIHKGLYTATDWEKIIFNSDVLARFLHMLLASYISAAFIISSVSAYYLLKNKHVAFAKTCFSFIWGAMIIVMPLQMFIGDMNGINVFKYQPLKTAAMEGIWNSGPSQPFLVFAWPDQALQKNEYALKIPHMASLINTHTWDGQMTGLKSVPRKDQPNVAAVFFSFRIMVGLGVLMLLLALIALYLRIKKRLFTTTWFLRACCVCAPIGFIALWTGWITAEMGRQPWVVYGLLRTSQAASFVTFNHILFIFALIILVYGVVFGFFYTYFLRKIFQKGPQDVDSIDVYDQPFQYMASSIKGEQS